MSESLEQALERFGFTIDGDAYERVNGTATEIIRALDTNGGTLPSSLLEECELEIRAYGAPRVFVLDAFDIVANLEETDGAYPQNKEDR